MVLLVSVGSNAHIIIFTIGIKFSALRKPKTIKISFDIVMKEDMKQDELISKISNIKGLTEVVLIAAKSDVDY